MKKLFALILAALMLFTCTACAEEAVEAAAFEGGTIEGRVYTSTMGGFSFTAPQGYEYFSEEMIAEAFNITTETLEIESDETTVYDMYCFNGTENSSINVNFENLVLTHGADCTVDEYIETCMTSYKITFNSFEDVVLMSIEDSTMELDGMEFGCIEMVLDNDGTEFYETLLVRKVNNYMMTFTVAAYSREEMNNICSAIKAV